MPVSLHSARWVGAELVLGARHGHHSAYASILACCWHLRLERRTANMMVVYVHISNKTPTQAIAVMASAAPVAATLFPNLGLP